MRRHGSAAKANLVAALKAMARDLAQGEAVSAVLDASPIWATYRDQRHDLFLTNTAVAGYLTGSRGCLWLCVAMLILKF